jgi:hypothetical protein
MVGWGRRMRCRGKFGRNSGRRDIHEIFGRGARTHLKLLARHPLGGRPLALQEDFAQTRSAPVFASRGGALDAAISAAN